jgi:hypothetical protein
VPRAIRINVEVEHGALVRQCQHRVIRGVTLHARRVQRRTNWCSNSDSVPGPSHRPGSPPPIAATSAWQAPHPLPRDPDSAGLTSTCRLNVPTGTCLQINSGVRWGPGVYLAPPRNAEGSPLS